ncbi:MAG TPA: hypothetical protein VLT10_00470 [Verrucomicrobiae bacterium]|nr:hypothetical protein [Verrucomicrobiae bacterium]
MKGKTVAALIVLSFFIGTMSASLISSARGDTIDPTTLLSQAITALASAIKSPQGNIDMHPIASNTGNFTVPQGVDAVSLYGSNLCGITFSDLFGNAPPPTLLIEFGGTTHVQNNAASCQGFDHGNIQLTGGANATFHNGDRLVLIHSPIGSGSPLTWTEVSRVRS